MESLNCELSKIVKTFPFEFAIEICNKTRKVVEWLWNMWIMTRCIRCIIEYDFSCNLMIWNYGLELKCSAGHNNISISHEIFIVIYFFFSFFFSFFLFFCTLSNAIRCFMQVIHSCKKHVQYRTEVQNRILKWNK